MRFTLALALLAAVATLLSPPSATAQCRADADASGELDFFDFLKFQMLFAAGDPRADFTGDGGLDVADFLQFQEEFALGCPVAAQLAGVELDSYPHFNYTRAFNAGDTVKLAIDPTRFPSIAGASGDIYIVAAKTAAQWAADPALDDVRGGPQNFDFAAGSIQENTIALTGSEALQAGAGLDISSGYDLVVDLNMNARLDGGDIIDGGAGEPGFSVVTNLVAPGPLTPVMLDTSLSAGAVRLNYPAEIQSLERRPIVIIVHGGGHDYRWYDYLQNHLSSWGYISISIRNDFSTTGGVLVRHTDALIAAESTVAGGALSGRIDARRIIWIGHSLGGREVVIGAQALATGALAGASFGLEDIVLVSAIAANSGDGVTRADPGAVNFHMIWGSADGDISGYPQGTLGEQRTPFRHYDLATGFKHSTYIHGADHNDFNCCGANNFMGPPETEIGREEAQRIAKAAWLALVKRYAEGDAPALDYLTRPWETFRPLGVSAGTTVVHMYRAPAAGPGTAVLEDYQTNPSTSLSSSGAPVIFDVEAVLEDKLMDTDGVFTWVPGDAMNGMTYARAPDTSRGAVFEWPSGPRFVEFAVPAEARDASAFDLISMRVCQVTRHPLTIAELEDLTFTVTLRDGEGRSSSIDISVYGGGVEEPYHRHDGFPGDVGWQNEFETIRIRLTDFTTNATGLDLSDLAAVRLDFGGPFGSDQGRVGLDEVEFVLER